MKQALDISVCPLADNQFNRCKSNIKWLESTMSGAAVVASDVYPCAQSIEHGKTGYLAKRTKDWVKCLSDLIENEDKRKQMVKNAQKEVKDNYASPQKWIDFYKYLDGEK